VITICVMQMIAISARLDAAYAELTGNSFAMAIA
jgi:hypothetical protein